MPDPYFHPAPPLLDRFFRAASGQFPDCVALDIPPGFERPGRTRLTFVELAEIVDAWRDVFVQRGIGPGDIVAVWCARTTVNAFAVPVAALECGAAWVSIDPSFPDGHAQRIVADANPSALVVDEATVSRAQTVAPGIWVPHRPTVARSESIGISNAPSAGRSPYNRSLPTVPITESPPDSQSISRHD
ncbi:MAG: AMP-binding protein, partial [Armatimonadaceae bacterium]